MRQTTRSSRSADPMLQIVQVYLDAGGTEPIDLDEVARFAINNGHWKKHASKLLQMCKRDFSRAFREQFHTDSQGREVRTYHAARSRDTGGAQRVFWADMRTASADHMETAFHQRREQIVGDCTQLKRDIDSYNDNNRHGSHYQLELSFVDDVAEREQPKQYRPAKAR